MFDIQCYRNLGAAIAMQAAKDYEHASPAMRRVIIKDLRSQYMDTITNGMGAMLADALKKDHKTVIRRIKNMEEDC